MKLFLKLASISIVLLLSIIVVVISIIDPNDYKQQIQDQVKNNINRELTITGDLGWSFYPILGFKSGEITLHNSPEFTEKTLLKVNNTAISINVLPLLKGKIQIGKIILEGAEFNLITNKDGLSNLDNLQPAVSQVEQEKEVTTNITEENSKTEVVDLSEFVLSGISISDVKLQIIDHQKKDHQEISINKMELGEFAFDKTAHFSLSSIIKNKQLAADIALETDLFIDSALTTFSLTNLNVESEILTQALPGTTINTTLTSALKYQINSQQLEVSPITINNVLTGAPLSGDIYIETSNIQVMDNNKLSLDKLAMTSNLTGDSLEKNQLETYFDSNLALNLQKKTASINKFELTNTLTGTDLQGSMNITLKQLEVSNFENIAIKHLKMLSEFNAPNVHKEKINTLVESDITYDLTQQKVSLTDLKSKLNDLRLDGDISFKQQSIPVIRYNLKGNVWNVNPYLNKPAIKEEKNTQVTATTVTAEQKEPDLSILKSFDVKGNLTLDGLLYEEIVIGKITNHLIVKNGKATLSPLTAKLYNGTLNVNGWTDEAKGKNKYKVTTKIKNITLMPLLKAAAQIDMLSGKANINVVASGQGLTSEKIHQGANAKGDFKIVDGELYGINIPQEIRILKAKIKGDPLPTNKDVKKTDFASLIGEFTLQKGIINNQKLIMLSPVMRLDGTGLADTLKENINYKLGVTPLSKSHEKTDYLDLNGITIPLLIEGTFTEPTFKLDTSGALKEQLKANKKILQEKAKKELLRQQQKLQGKSKDELKEEAKKLENKFKSFFR
ncbi:AsmA family protein [Psychromonas sp. RZ22]|uniref:AsmA family protein n=1 Tax=Psychromonas algarum TaxID=2555643 RepID=UPI0010686CE6|nr:AsmA family protein [Psychromonas sp. RZ22]TEW53733.1 AsmA family protein [Psychromonas sp. RZ22]